jgi:hypothetical protein
MARIEVTTEAGRTTIVVRRSAKEWIGFLPQILGVAGTFMIAALAGFRFRVRLGDNPAGPWVALLHAL